MFYVLEFYEHRGRRLESLYPNNDINHPPNPPQCQTFIIIDRIIDIREGVIVDITGEGGAVYYEYEGAIQASTVYAQRLGAMIFEVQSLGSSR